MRFFKLRLHSNSNTNFFPDISHMDRTKDLRKHGELSVLVKRAGATISDSILNNYVKVEEMDPLLEQYCDTYSKDLAKRLAVDSENLPDSLALPTLLNPMFGSKHTIIGSGLMTEKQYDNARNLLIRRMQDILDIKYPPMYDDSDDEDDNSEVEEDGSDDEDNSNYGKAKKEVK